jgi:hypothetical protein
MGAIAYVSDQQMIMITCWARESCGISFGVPREFYQMAIEQGFTLCCPRGHLLSFGESEVTKLKQRLKWREQRLKWREEQLEKANARANALKGVVTRTKNRVAHGVCPCCRCSFQNLKRHMKTKHPSYVKDAK